MLGAAVLIAATVGCSGRGSTGHEGIRGTRAAVPVVAISSSEVGTRIVGGSPRQQAALRKIVAGIGRTSIRRIAIRKPKSGWKPFDKGDVVVSLATERGSKNLRGTWEAWLVAGIFHDVSDEAGLPPVVVAETDGDAVRLGRGVPAEQTPPPHATPEAARALAERVQKAAAESGTELADFSILEPAGLAFAVTLKTDDPARFLKKRFDPFLELMADTGQFEGAYFRVIDGDGETVWSAANASRMPVAANGTTRPELRGCDPIGTFPLDIDDVPPPCPA
jgi:hypothetical protein